MYDEEFHVLAVQSSQHMQLCIKKVDTKAVMTVRMKLPILSAGIFLKSFIIKNLELNINLDQGVTLGSFGFLLRVFPIVFSAHPDASFPG